MVVLGQPKAHAEYIQATSRVGRDDARPGLILTLLNVHKPRDRSHYERFRHYHETFYRSVEVGSVTPFAARALDRGFAGALVALSRHAEAVLTPAEGAARIAEVRAALERFLLNAFLERVREQPLNKEEREERLRSVQNRVGDLLDSWCKIFDDYYEAGVGLQYQKYELDNPRPLLRDMLDTDFESEHHRKFRANRSLRDVEPEVNLFLEELNSMNNGAKGHGQIRRSQVITTYGPGALIDLPRDSAIVGGLDKWPSESKLEEIDEPRLSRKLQMVLEDSSLPRLYAPPAASNVPGEVIGIGGWRFPEWFVVQEARAAGERQRSRRLVHRKALEREI